MISSQQIIFSIWAMIMLRDVVGMRIWLQPGGNKVRDRISHVLIIQEITSPTHYVSRGVFVYRQL